MRYLLHDRDPLFCRSFRELLASSGVKCVHLPARSPNLNAYAERFVGSIRHECLDRVIPLGERHLRRIVGQYVEHYNTERNHQGIANRLIEPTIAANGGGTRHDPVPRTPWWLAALLSAGGRVMAWIEFW